MKDESNEQPWGFYRLKGRERLTWFATRLGLGRGRLKDKFKKAYSLRRQDAPVDIVRFGLKWRLHYKDNTTEGKILTSSKQRDKKELRHIKQAVTNQGTFVDIGANSGYYSLMAANYGAQYVLAIEPNPTVFSRLVFNIQANNFQEKISAIQVAAGESEGLLTLYPNETDLGGTRKVGIEKSSQQPIHVDVKPLLQILIHKGITRIDAMKIDVEGMEPEILIPFFSSASRKTWPATLVIERPSIRPNKDNNDIVKYLSDLGYQSIGKTHSNLIMKLDQ